jgi:hypothetical protein
MARRMSLGGAARNVLRDSSSRYNSSLASSFGGEDGTPQKTRQGLLDTSGISDGPSTRGRASSVGRRQTLGGGSDALKSETPSKSSRREMLAAWRQSRKGGGDDTENKKRIRGNDGPPLPPSFNTSSTPASEHGTYQSRKHQRVENEEPLSLSQNSALSPSIHYYDDESASEVSRGGISMASARAPLVRVGRLGSARRRTLLGRSTIQQEGKDSSENFGVFPIFSYPDVACLLFRCSRSSSARYESTSQSAYI